MPRSNNRLAAVSIDANLAAAATLEAKQDQALAINDIVEGNDFTLSNGKPGPYRLHITAQDQRLVLDFKSEEGQPLYAFGLSLTPFRRVAKDYFQICDSYVMALRGTNTQNIEAIDMARRAIHNEGSEILRERLKGKATMDFDTARRLFTLVCAIMPHGGTLPPVATKPLMALFVCTQNAIRSPMAAAITHHFFGQHIYAASAGIMAGDPDPFVGMVMDEINIDLKSHRPHSLEEIAESGFDLVMTLSPEATSQSKSFATSRTVKTENWLIADPSQTQGSREQILDAYRAVRDDLVKRVKHRFGT